MTGRLRGDVAEADGVRVRPAESRDTLWLLRSGLSFEHAGTRYRMVEWPLQLAIAPARAIRIPRLPSYVVELDGVRVGWVGANPLSGNLEYWLDPPARGKGNGTSAIAAFLLAWRRGRPDRSRSFHVSRKNPRSLRALRNALDRAGWREGVEFEVEEARHGWWVRADPFSV